MLVLTRKLLEQIIVPECNLTFTVLEIRKDKVRIGITAPTHVAVHRHEVWTRISAAEKEEPQTRTKAVV